MNAQSLKGEVCADAVVRQAWISPNAADIYSVNEAVSSCFQHVTATRAMGVFFICLAQYPSPEVMSFPPCGGRRACVVARASCPGCSDVGRTYAELNARGMVCASSNSILLGHPEAMAK